MAGNVPGIDPQLTAMSIKELRTAKANGQITNEQYNQILEFKAEQSEKGTTVEHSQGRPLTPEEQAAKQHAELNNQIKTSGMKITPEKAGILEKTLKAMNIEQKQEVLTLLKNIDEARKQNKPTQDAEKKLDDFMKPFILKGNGAKTDEAAITTHRTISSEGERGTTFTADLKAPTKQTIDKKHSKLEEKQALARYYDSKTHKWIEADKATKEDLKQVKEELKAKEKELKQQAKADKKELKALDKQKKAADKQGGSDALNRQIDAKEAEISKRNAAQEYVQVKQARKAAQGKGVGTAKRAHNANSKAEKRIAYREVYFDEKDVPKDAKKDNVRVLTGDDKAVLRDLISAAVNAYDVASSPKDKAIWRELAGLRCEFDKNGKIKKDKNGEPILKDLDQIDVEAVKDALIDITGGDMRLNYSEQQIVKAETGRSMSDIRHMFKAFGFEAPHPLGKRIVNGLKEAAPVLATMGLAQLLSKNKAKAAAHAEDYQKAEATVVNKVTTVAEDTQTATNSATAFAEAFIDDQKISTWDEFGRSKDLRIAGAYASDTQTATATATAYAKAVAEATAKAHASASAFASATAIAEAVAKLSPAGLIAAPALAFLAGFAKAPVENSAVKDANAEKMVRLVNVYKKNSGKDVGNQIIQLQKELTDLTGSETLGVALVASILEHDIGSQNTNPTLRELRASISHIKAVIGEVKRMKTVKTDPPAPEPTPNPNPPKPEIHKHIEPKTNFKFDVRGAGPAAYIQACYGVKPGSPEFKAIMNALYEQNPGLKNNNYKLNTPVFMPTVKIGDKEFAPDLRKRPAQDRVVKKKVGYKGNNDMKEYYGPHKTHDGPHAEMTKEQALKKAQEELKEQ